MPNIHLHHDPASPFSEKIRALLGHLELEWHSVASSFHVGPQAACCTLERPMREDDDMADPDHIAETYLQLHRQHRSTWAFEVVLRPWKERW